MRDVGLTFPVYMTVRNSGDALVTIATTLDPSDTDWQQASEIVCRIIAREGWLRSVAWASTALRYRERRGDKRRRRDGRLMLSNGFDTSTALQRFLSCHCVFVPERFLSGLASAKTVPHWWPNDFKVAHCFLLIQEDLWRS